MAANYHLAGSVGTGHTFPKPVNHLNIYVDTGVTFTISFDNGTTYITVPVGLYSMPVGIVKNILVTSTGAFSIVGVQA